MNRSELFKAAHKLTRATIQPGDDYRITFGACLKLVRRLFSEGWTMDEYGAFNREDGPDAEWLCSLSGYNGTWRWAVDVPTWCASTGAMRTDKLGWEGWSAELVLAERAIHLCCIGAVKMAA